MRRKRWTVRWRDVPAAEPGVCLVCRLLVRMAIERLPSHQRRTVILRYVDDLTIAEIARREGITRQAAWTTLIRAHAELRRILQPGGRDSGP